MNLFVLSASDAGRLAVLCHLSGKIYLECCPVNWLNQLDIPFRRCFLKQLFIQGQ
jgi:hypothetical protein